jgi:hypothetical protein
MRQETGYRINGSKWQGFQHGLADDRLELS